MLNNVDSIIANAAFQQTSAPPCSPRLFLYIFSAPWQHLVIKKKQKKQKQTKTKQNKTNKQKTILVCSDQQSYVRK